MRFYYLNLMGNFRKLNVMKIRFKLYHLIFLLVFSATVFSQEQDSLLLIGGFSTNGLYGYINKYGKVVIKPQYDWAGDFHEGIAVVKIEKGRFGFINQSGNLLYECDGCSSFDDFSEGLITVEFKKPYGTCFLDKFGNNIFGRSFWWASDFHEGFAAVEYCWQGKTGFIDKTGNLIIDTLYTCTWRFSDGYTTGYKKDEGKWGIIDTTGRFVPVSSNIVPERYFNNGLNMILDTTSTNGDLSKSKWGYMNTKGNIVIRPKFIRAKEFSEGLAAVETEKGWGYIDTMGEFVLEPIYNDADCFSEGLAAVFLGNDVHFVQSKNAFINRRGEVIIRGDFWYPIPFKNGFSKYWTGYHFTGDIEYIRNDGKIIWPKLH